MSTWQRQVYAQELFLEMAHAVLDDKCLSMKTKEALDDFEVAQLVKRRRVKHASIHKQNGQI